MWTAWHLARAAAIGWWNDRALSLGAYYTVFSLAPLLLVAIAIAGLVFGREAAQAALVEEISALAGPEAAEAIRTMLASAGDVGSGVIGTVLGVATFLVFVTGALFELQDDLNIIFRVERAARSGVLAFLRTRLFSLALIVAIGFLLLVSLVVDAALTAASQYIAGAWPLLLRALNFVVSLAATAALFALVFKLLPDANLAWREVAVGAFVTAILFALGKFAIGYYLGKSDLASTYGAAASIITILLWIYYSSQILLFGAEFTRAYAEHRGSRPMAG
jgi:membrane protein